MSRSSEIILQEALSLLPTGWAWPRSDDTESVLSVLLNVFAQGLADLELLAEQCFQEIDPRTANECIDDFERVLGRDPCISDFDTLSLSKRQQIAHMRWTARGGASIAYFVHLADLYGIQIEVSEFTTSQADWLCADDELIEDPCQYLWEVTIPSLLDDEEFYADDSVAGDRLWDFEVSDIECILNRVKPAHTQIIFRYKDES